jgi:hypothetical protein
MKPAEITKIQPIVANTTPTDPSEEPKVVRIAKLGLILADPESDPRDKVMCVKLSVRQGIITEEEAATLLAHRAELESFMEEPNTEE